jgi:amidase
MPHFGQELMELAQEKGPLTEAAYTNALEANLRLARSEGIDATIRKHELDAIVAPTGGPAWLIDRVHGDYGISGCSSPAAVAGYPHVTVPAGYVGGLPIGLSFFGAAWEEARLIRFAFAFERATQARRTPSLRE